MVECLAVNLGTLVSSQQRLDDAETCFWLVLVLGMQDSGDPAEVPGRRLTAEPTAGFLASPVVCVAEIHFLVICVLSQTENIK